ncbi:hypothetical protein ES332_A10G220300v1 [Gossypium tomentosum]|uniref:Uncharacterized protein n=1 Tax=Gossypium tomentosum TaxID=34277 RepID=A0A5D2NTK1_GOSTO|nr:hypothetical protein ES332_A10G220300v1 [Gossypium tomentosum]
MSIQSTVGMQNYIFFHFCPHCFIIISFLQFQLQPPYSLRSPYSLQSPKHHCPSLTLCSSFTLFFIFFVPKV